MYGASVGGRLFLRVNSPPINEIRYSRRFLIGRIEPVSSSDWKGSIVCSSTEPAKEFDWKVYWWQINFVVTLSSLSPVPAWEQRGYTYTGCTFTGKENAAAPSLFLFFFFISFFSFSLLFLFLFTFIVFSPFLFLHCFIVHSLSFFPPFWAAAPCKERWLSSTLWHPHSSFWGPAS